jgi:hypothetical protein
MPLALRFSAYFRQLDIHQPDKFHEGLLIISCVPLIRTLKLLRRFVMFQLVLQAFQLSLEALPMCVLFYFVLLIFYTGVFYLAEPQFWGKGLGYAWALHPIR